jgi:hypothetical protein
MLELPEDWHRCTTQEVISALLHQAHAIGQYPAAARAAVKAAVEFMLAGPRWSKPTRPVRFKSRDNVFRVNDWFLYVLPDTSDDALRAIADLPKVRGEIDLLAPPWSQFLYRHAVKAAYPKRRIDVVPIDTFCDSRMYWTSLDIQVLLKQTASDPKTNFLNRYRTLTQPTPAITIPPPTVADGTIMGRRE